MREFEVAAADGASLFAVEDGSGPALVMLHGPMADHRAAWPIVASLASRALVVAPDIRGNGRSRFAGPITFEQLSSDVGRLLDHLDVPRAIVAGVSGGSGVALHFALTQPDRVAALVLVKPVYAGAEHGYTDQQKQIFAGMNAVASRAVAEGVQVLRPLYATVPDGVREKALAMIEGLDPASVVATSHFVASGMQPFGSASELAALQLPTLLIRGDDAIHPSVVSDLYAKHIPSSTVLPADADVPRSIREFMDRL